MGNKDSQLASLLHENHDLWTITHTTPLSIRVQHRLNHREGEQYSLEESELRKHSSLYALRRTFESVFVAIYDIIRQSSHRTCSSNGMVSIIVEHIPYRLSDLGAISFEEAMYILSTVLHGYSVLAKNQVPFYLIDDINICFNPQGQCKFWINENLYQSIPPSNRLVNQFVFISELFHCIEERTSDLDPNFLKKKQQLGALSLNKAFQLVESHRIGKVDHIAAILELEQNSPNNSGICPGKVSVAKWRGRRRNNPNISSDIFRQRIREYNLREDDSDNKVSLSHRGLSCRQEMRFRLAFKSPYRHIPSKESKQNPQVSTAGRVSPPF